MNKVDDSAGSDNVDAAMVAKPSSVRLRLRPDSRSGAWSGSPPAVARRASPAPPAGLADPVSRREAAALLGFASDFKVRQLEKAGHLHPARGAMGQAWYPRAEVLAMRAVLTAALPQGGEIEPHGPGRTAVGRRPHVASAEGSLTAGQWSDAELIAHLRLAGAKEDGLGPTVVDLVVDAGVSIARAQKVYQFWLTHDRHPTAENARRAGRVGAPPPLGSPRAPLLAQPARPEDSRLAGIQASAAVAGHSERDRVGESENESEGDGDGDGKDDSKGERRDRTRLDRDTLIRQLRDPDPKLRAQAFRMLRSVQVPPAAAKRQRTPGGIPETP